MEDFVHSPLPHVLPTFGAISPLSVIKVEKASAIWKVKRWDPILWLREFFKRDIEEGSTPSDW